ncbi:phage terminase small subunit-related protein [Pectinatus sottacetonis]|uniref:phage terminase small subunit-related protein n=1 Tax=Pectinatus sottacetonis TaxID=1002795 RepID=UPI001E631AB4|nr:phage terminase small subunit-related protein [Pectinatus sottacetonis]
MKYKDIAAKYDVSLSTVKSWKTRYKWSRDKAKKVCVQNKKSTRTKKEKVRIQNEDAKPISIVSSNIQAMMYREYQSIMTVRYNHEERIGIYVMSMLQT